MAFLAVEPLARSVRFARSAISCSSSSCSLLSLSLISVADFATADGLCRRLLAAPVERVGIDGGD